MDHPSEEILKSFATGTASGEESRAVVAHLIKGCALCATRLRRLIEPPKVTGPSYEAALDRFDQEMVGGLKKAVDPRSVLRELLKGARPRPVEEVGAKKKE
jgi:hypothetical protein